MNKSTVYTQPGETTGANTLDVKNETDAPTTKHENQNVKSEDLYTPDSIWSHVWYGTGALIVVSIPPLIPGITVRMLVLGYAGVAVTVYGIVCVWGIIRCLRPSKPHRKIRH